MNDLNTLLSGTGFRLLLTAVILIIAVVILTLLLRGFRNWYWKTDEIIDSMKTMDKRMDNIESGLEGLKDTAERMDVQLQESRLEMTALQENARLLLEERRTALPDPEGPLLREKEAAAALDAASARAGEIRQQTADLEKEVAELKRQKQQLQDEINARIRD